MKLQLTVGEHKMMGYEYLDAQNEKFTSDYMDLSAYSKFGQSDEIYAPTILDYVLYESHEGLITYWAKLLKANGGKIVIGGTDAYLTAKQVVNRDMPLPELNAVLFRRTFSVIGITSARQTRVLLEGCGLIIDSIDIQKNNFCVTARRP